MKKLFILATFLSSLVMSSVVNAEWIKVLRTESGNDVYVDFDRIKRHDGKVYYWGLVDELKPSASGTISYIFYYEADCKLFRYKWLRATYYKGPMGSGEVGYETTNSQDKNWTYPSSGRPAVTPAEIMLKAVCPIQNMQ